MSAEANKAVIRQLVEAHGGGDVGRIRELLSPRFVWHMGNQAAPMGRDDYTAGVVSGRRAFSDLSVTLEDSIAEADKVAIRLTVRGRHTGEFGDLAPTGRSLEFTSLWIYRVVDGRVAEAWHLDEDIKAKLRG